MSNKLASLILSVLTLLLVFLVYFLLFPWHFGVIEIISIYEMAALVGLAFVIASIYLALQKFIKNQTIFLKTARALMMSIAFISLWLAGLVSFFIVLSITNSQYNLSIGYQYFQMFSLIAVAILYLSGSFFAKKRNHFNGALGAVLIALIIGALFGITQSSLSFFVVESLFFGYTWEISSFLWTILSFFALITLALSKKEFKAKKETNPLI
jgi:hypothetical protein